MARALTKKKQKVVNKWGPFVDFLPAMVTEHGLTGAADILGVTKATMGNWLLKEGIKTRFVATLPGDTLWWHGSNGELKELP